VEDLNLGLLRFQVARARGDFGPVAWYCERFVQDLLRGGLRSSPAEALLGGFDLREGRHGLAWLCALRLQGLAMRAASTGDPDGAQGLLKQAGTYCGSSKRAQVQQERAARWVEDR
jgi:hypothetical protein